MSAARTVHRALLRLYPASFREEYAGEMEAIFRSRYRAAGVGGARLGVLLDVAVDTLRNAPAIHWDIMRQDLRHAARALRRTALLSATVVLVAAIGIGATTATFSLADHVLIRPLPFDEPDRLVKVWEDHSYRGYPRMELSPPNFRDWSAQARSVDTMAAYSTVSANLLSAGEPLRLNGLGILGDLFGVLRARPLLGRTLTPEDQRAEAPPVIVVSEQLWRTRFNADPAIVGRAIIVAEGLLNDQPRTVVGIMPAAFDFPNRTVDFWIAFQFRPDMFEDRNNNMLQAIARLKPGISRDAARAELNVIVRQLARTYPDVNRQAGATVIALRDEVSKQARLLLWGLVAASAGVLLIACANLAGLFLARGLARQRELAVRAALGAGRGRLLRQLVTEGALLAAAGGVSGLALAVVAMPSVARLVPATLPIAETPIVDARMLTVAAIATLATVIAFAVLPALRTGGQVDASALREATRSGSSRRTERLRSALVIAEVAAAVVLLVSSSLLVRALIRVQQTNPGFDAEGVLTLRTALPTDTYASPERRQQFYDTVLAQVRALPGVTGASYISFLPMVMRGGIWPVTVDGRPADPSSPWPASLRFVTPGFFDTLRIPLRAGRDVSSHDVNGTPDVAVVSESFVRTHWPGLDPIGRRLNIGFRDRTVVGVVGDVKVRGLERESEPQVYLPAQQVPEGGLIFYAPKELVVRSSTPPLTLVAAIRAIVARVDPQQPVSDVKTLTDVVAADTAPRRVQVRVIGAFAAIALLLAAIGLHALLAFNVSRRARDIGVRMALGAERGAIVAMVLRHGFALAATGVVAGGVLALAAARSMQALLAGVSPSDPATFVAAVALCLVMTLAGSLLPALRAVRVDPIQVIRTE